MNKKLIVILAAAFVIIFGTSIAGKVMAGGSGVVQYAQVRGTVQTVSIDIEPKKYAPIVVQKGIPVRFIVKADSSALTSCNNTIIIPKYGIEKVLQPGENLIEFTPQKTGSIPYSCKMGMVKSKIKVVNDVSKR